MAATTRCPTTCRRSPTPCSPTGCCSARARALMERRDHALPDDVQALADAVLSHRLMLVPEAAGTERSAVIADAVSAVPAL